MKPVVLDAPGVPGGEREVVGKARAGHAVIVGRHPVLCRELRDVGAVDDLAVAAVLHDDDENVGGGGGGSWAGKWRFGRGMGHGPGPASGHQEEGDHETGGSPPLFTPPP